MITIHLYEKSTFIYDVKAKSKILDHYGLKNKYYSNLLRVDEDSCKDQDLYCLHQQSIHSKCHHFFHLSPEMWFNDSNQHCIVVQLTIIRMLCDLSTTYSFKTLFYYIPSFLNYSNY